MVDEKEKITPAEEAAVQKRVDDYLKTLEEKDRKEAGEQLKILLKDNRKLFLDYIEATKKLHTELAAQIPGYDLAKNPDGVVVTRAFVMDQIDNAKLPDEKKKALKEKYETWRETTKAPFEQKLWIDALDRFPAKGILYPLADDAIGASRHMKWAAQTAVQADMEALRKKQPAPGGVESKMSELLTGDMQSLAAFNQEHAGNTVTLPPRPQMQKTVGTKLVHI